MLFTPLVPTDNVDADTVNTRLAELNQSISNLIDGSLPLDTPDIADFTNSQHDHTDVANGGQIPLSALSQSGATSGQLVVWSGTEWEPSDQLATITTKGDLLTRDASDLARLPVGTNGHALIADSAQTTGLKWARPTPVATGTYTGNGAATQAITGVGFQPKVVMIWIHGTGGAPPLTAMGVASDADGGYTRIGETTEWNADHITTLGADGFTVGDGTGGASNRFNYNTYIYTYVCW